MNDYFDFKISNCQDDIKFCKRARRMCIAVTLFNISSVIYNSFITYQGHASAITWLGIGVNSVCAIWVFTQGQEYKWDIQLNLDLLKIYKQGEGQIEALNMSHYKFVEDLKNNNAATKECENVSANNCH